MVQYASEFRYSPSPLTRNALTIGVTQSGGNGRYLLAAGLEMENRSAVFGLQQDEAFAPHMLGITNRS